MSPESWQPELPFQDLPKLPPRADLESKAILKSCIKARAALAELKRASQLIPNQSMLINTLPILEAQASSEIENVVTTSDEVFRHLGNERAADPATKEALQYRRALMEGLKSLADRPLCTATAELVCSHIKASDVRVRKVPGTKLTNISTGEVTYTPPQGEAVLRTLLGNWEQFLHSDDELDPLIRLAVGHYQFEAIHPFTDGNGRTGRILNSLFLIESELLTLPILYLSRYIIRHKKSYYAGLLGVTRKEAWEPWILFLLKGIEETAQWTLQKIDVIRELADSTASYLQEAAGSIYSKDLIDTLFQQPYCRISHLVDAGLGQRQTASRYLKRLCDVGVLTERSIGRDKLFVNTRLLHVLTNDDRDFPPLTAS